MDSTGTSLQGRITKSPVFPITQDCLDPRNCTGTGHLTIYVEMKHRWGGHFKQILYEKVETKVMQKYEKSLSYLINSFAGLSNAVRLSLTCMFSMLSKLWKVEFYFEIYNQFLGELWFLSAYSFSSFLWWEGGGCCFGPWSLSKLQKFKDIFNTSFSTAG